MSVKMTNHILITGATSGIGKAIAQSAAAQGLAVSITGLEPETESQALCADLKERGASSVFYGQVDLSDSHAARALIGKVADAHNGRLDMVVNNAGMQYVAPIEAFPIDAWDKVIALNLSAAFHITAEALPLMRAGGFGRIVNIASVHGLVASKDKVAYVAAKHGIIGLTKTTALETAEEPITCNAICPGWVRTPLVEAQIEKRAKQAGRPIDEEARLLVSEKQPSGQFVTTDEIAEMVMYLMSDKAGMITGSQFVMDGGWTAQ